MAKLYFKVSSDVDKVIQLRQEIAKLKQELMSMDVNKAPAAAKALQVQIGAATQEFNKLTTEAAKAGVVMENDFKSKIYQGSQAVNDFTQKIINQKAVVKDVEADVRRLGESYRSSLKNNPLSASGKLSEYTSAKKALDEEKASLFGLTQEQANARLSVKKIRDEYALYRDESKETIKSNDGVGISLTKAFALIGGAAAGKELVSNIIRVRGEFQAADTAIQTLLGSKEKADALMAQVKEYAKISPLEFSDVTQATQMMLGFNIEAEKVPQYLRAIGDISMGETGKFNSLTLAFSQMSATGKLMGQDLNQMINAGFNPLQQISLTTGKSIAQLKDEMSKGAISAEMVQKAFVDATSAGGKFFGMSENASKTINGQISMMQDAMDEALNEMGQKSEGVIMSGIKTTTSLIQNYETVGKVLVGLVVTYGVYKTALIANIALTHSWAVATRVDAVAKGIQTIATKAQTVAQLALNSAMKANPYVLAATLIVGTVSAMWALRDSTTAAEKANVRYNKTIEEQNQKEEERKNNIEELISTIQDNNKAEGERLTALEALKKEYSNIFDKYLTETEFLKEILKYKRLIAEEDGRRTNITDQEQLRLEQLKLYEYENNKKKGIIRVDLDGNGWGETNVDDAIKAQLEIVNKAKAKVAEYSVSSYLPGIKALKDGEITSTIDDINKSLKSLGKSGDDAIAVVSSLGGEFSKKQLLSIKSGLETEENVRSGERKSGSDWLSDAKNEYQKALKDLKDFESSKTKLAQEEYNRRHKELKDNVDAEEKKYKNLGGVTGSSLTKQENQAEKLRKEQEKLALLTNKQALEQSRSEQDLQNQVDQARIDSMKEGSTKTLAQMQLNHKKEMQQFEREKEDRLRKAIEDARAIFDVEEDAKKAKNPKYIKGTFDASGVKLSNSDAKQYDTQKGFIGEKQKRETEEYYKFLRDSYQDYTDQRIAIEEKFNTDIATLQESRKKYEQEGNTEKVQQTDRAIAQATKDKGQGLMQLDYDKLKESPKYVRAFENLKQTSSETLNSLLSQFESAKHTAAKVLSPDQLREYTTTIQEIMDELDARNPWQALSDKKQELAEAEQELAEAQMALENARQTAETVKGGGKVEYTTTKFNQKTGKIDSTKAYLTEAQALDNVKDKTDKYNKSKDNVVEKSAKVKKAEKEVTEQIDELSKTISDLGSVIGGSAGEIIGLIGNIGSFTMMAMTGVEAAADTSAQAISTVEKASVILAIIGAAVQIATKIFDLFGKDTTTEKYEDAKEAYESYINILDRVIEKQLELAESLSGDNANAAYEKAIEAIKEQSRNAKVLGQQYLNSGASGKSHSKGYNEVEDMSWEGWNQAAQALGMTIDQFKNKMGGRMTGLFDLTDEQLVKLQDKAGIFWSQLDSDTQDYANQVADGVAKVAEVMEQRMADVTLLDVDSLRSDFQDLLTDMDADSADFAGNFEEYMKNAIINSMIKEEYMGKLESWRKKFYNAMAGGVTEEEYNALKAEGQQLSDEMKAKQEAMKEMYGWTSGESSSQDSTNGGFETMSQDEVKELNGRFTALQIAGEEIKNQNILQSQSLNLLTFKTDAILSVNTEVRNIADETRTILANSYLELVQISENTGESAKYLKEIKSDIAEVKKNTKAMAG